MGECDVAHVHERATGMGAAHESIEVADIPYGKRVAIGYLASAMFIVLALSRSLLLSTVPALAVLTLSLLGAAAWVRLIRGSFSWRPFRIIMLSVVLVAAISTAGITLVGDFSWFYGVLALLMGIPASYMLVLLIWTNPPRS